MQKINHAGMPYLTLASFPTLTLTLALSLTTSRSNAQIFCPDTGYYSPPDVEGVIHWEAFPEFNLPEQWKMVYEGPRLDDELMLPLSRGFSHIANQVDNFGAGDYNNLPPEKRALTWYHIASCVSGEPWYDPCFSPWGNDTAAFKEEWSNRLGVYADMFSDTDGDTLPHVDLLVADIEAARINGFNDNADYIDSLYYFPDGCEIPQQYLDGTVGEFALQYQKDMMQLYNVPMKFVRQALNDNGYDSQLSAYGEGPVNTTYHKIDNYSWNEWITDESLVSYLVKDSDDVVSDDAPFYASCDFVSPHAYYIYDNDPYYLSYALFQVEVNDAWTDKDVVLYVFLRYNSGEYISPHMAEATAIMPMMSGADGLWVWDHYYTEESDTAHLKNYDYFIRGLYRLSEYSDYFEGDYEVVIPESAHSLFLSGDPVWRAVVNGPNILVAAQNPFADDGEITEITVNYGDWSEVISLVGKQVFLCDFVWDPNSVNEDSMNNSVHVYPNPFSEILNFKIKEGGQFQLEIFDALSQKVFESSFQTSCSLNTSGWSEGIYSYRVMNENRMYSGKLIR